jgi:transcription initiation factor TFIIE subunit alpha
MILTNKKLFEVIEEIVGESGVAIVKYLKDRKNISEFIVAEKTKLDMQSTRHILYKLNDYNIASYIRKKDRKKGWYISYWTFNRKRVKDLIDKLKNERLEKLKEQLKREEEHQGNFFICTRACARLDFDQATDFQFKCPECGSLLNQQDNTKTIGNIKEKIKELEA